MLNIIINDDEDKVRQMLSCLLRDSETDARRGVLYRSMLKAVEKPLMEHVLQRTEGNQLKAARILGINRNTMRSKIRKLGIDVSRWKAG